MTNTPAPVLKYVTYTRVSTARQGASGLGLEAQSVAIENFLRASKGIVLARFTETESGKRNDRPEFEKAKALCKKTGAILVIAKLDRLSRNVAFIANLMESGVDFVACDMPYANKLTLQIMAAFAEHERDAISRRTKDALAAAKARGTTLGNPLKGKQFERYRERLRATSKDHAALVRPHIEELMAANPDILQKDIAIELNRRKVTTLKRHEWTPKAVSRFMEEHMETGRTIEVYA
jgi:DNA invertase Pin-like site-specific DNA recombinase